MNTRKTVTWWDLFRTSWYYGLRRAFHRPPFFFEKIALARLLVPMDICRYYELPKVGTAILESGAKRVFDLSSPKLLACELARRSVRVVTSDAWEKEIESWSRFAELSGLSRDAWPTLRFCVTDGCQVSFPDETFDASYSISVIEHIDGDGDGRALKELSRITKKGGDIFLTVPYGKTAHEEYREDATYGKGKKTERGIFYMRVYDDRAIEERLLKPSGLRLVEKEPCTDIFPFIEMTLNAKLLPFSVAWGNLHPIFARVLHRPGRVPGESQTANIYLRLRKDG